SFSTLALPGRRALGSDVKGVQGLAGRHEEPVPLGAPEGHVAADLGEPDAPDELAPGRPYRHPAVAHGPAGVAGAPHVAVHVAAGAVGPALDTIDHEVAEELLVGELVVRPHVEDVHVTLAAGTGVAGPLAGADHVELLVVR